MYIVSFKSNTCVCSAVIFAAVCFIRVFSSSTPGDVFADCVLEVCGSFRCVVVVRSKLKCVVEVEV